MASETTIIGLKVSSILFCGFMSILLLAKAIEFEHNQMIGGMLLVTTIALIWLLFFKN